MKLYELSSTQRFLWADKLMDLANLSIVGLVFATVVSAEGFRQDLAVLGLVLYVGLNTLGTFLSRKESRR